MLQKLNNKLSNKKGFTLMEMLIVVAIIAVLVAIAIPVFGGQLAKANEATDAANIRVAYADAAVKAVTTGSDTTEESVKMVHTGKFGNIDATQIGGVDITNVSVTKGKTVTVKVSADGAVTITPAA